MNILVDFQICISLLLVWNRSLKKYENKEIYLKSRSYWACMVCIHILQFSAIYNHAMQLSFDVYGNEHHYQLLRCQANDLLRRQTNHLKGKLLN